MTMTTNANSFTTESEFYSHLATRLNADNFSYLAAVYEAGINTPDIALIFNNMSGATFAEIEAVIVAADIFYDEPALEEAYNILTECKTSVQIKNAQALILATRLINQFDFIGLPTDTTQTLQWPRTGAVDRNGQPIPEDSIPANIKTATAELALFLLNSDITNPMQYREIFSLSSVRIGESQNSYNKTANKKLPDNVTDILKPYLLEKSGFSSMLIV